MFREGGFPMIGLPPGARETAIRAALAGGRVLRHGVGQERSIRHKGEIDLVTEIDEASEAAIAALVRTQFPHHRILAEEGSVGGDDPRFRWIVDPLDGTTNYAHGLPYYCVSVAFELDGQLAIGAIYDPTADELFYAELGGGDTVNGRPLAVSPTDSLANSLLATGFPYDRAQLPPALEQFEAFSRESRAVRRLGSAALELAYVAAGRLDGYWERVINAWDVAAGLVILREAGGRDTNLRGEPTDVDAGQLLATNGRIHDQMLRVLARAGA
jgi:myo-inositol-1(or 4)-monophosphatase